MDGDEALALLSDIARADIADGYDDAGRLLPVRDWPMHLRRCVKSVRPGAFGDCITLYDAQRARELLARVAARLEPEASVATTLATLAQLLTGEFDDNE